MVLHHWAKFHQNSVKKLVENTVYIRFQEGFGPLLIKNTIFHGSSSICWWDRYGSKNVDGDENGNWISRNFQFSDPYRSHPSVNWPWCNLYHCLPSILLFPTCYFIFNFGSYVTNDGKKCSDCSIFSWEKYTPSEKFFQTFFFFIFPFF